MLIEYLMHSFGWDAVWCPDSTSFLYNLLSGDRYIVGVWTGPDKDLLCLKRCETTEEAEWWLSPGGPTIGIALLRAVLKHRRLTRAAMKSASSSVRPRTPSRQRYR